VIVTSITSAMLFQSRLYTTLYTARKRTLLHSQIQPGWSVTNGQNKTQLNLLHNKRLQMQTEFVREKIRVN